jgi:uncharacterized protein involved in response to NO
MSFAMLPPPLVAAVDLAFAPALTLLRSPPLWTSFKWPTLGFVPLLLALFAANLVWHLGAAGVVAAGPRLGAFLALDLFILMLAVMAGRLVPGYTRAMLIPLRYPKDPAREKASIVLALVLLVADLLSWPVIAAAAALVLGLLQGWRLAGWRTARTLDRPILLVLHIGFAWFAVGLLLRGVAGLTSWIALADAVHAITVGAIGTLTLGMMGRLARTQGRRPLAASPLDITGYALLAAAAFARAIVPALAPELREAATVAAGLFWMSGFLLFLAAHGRALARMPEASRAGRRG